MKGNGKSRNGKPLPGNGNGKTPPLSPSGAGIMPQPQGGYLRIGNPGNRGGPGRPRDRVRQAFLLSLEQRRPILEEIADGKLVQRVRRAGSTGEPVEVETSADAGERIRAMEALARVGLSTDPPRQTIGLLTDGQRVEVVVRYDDDGD